MTKSEACGCYLIPPEILEEYESWGLCKAVKRVMGDWQYDDQDLERLGMIMTLHDIGFTPEEVENYMKLMLAGASTENERMKMLEAKRSRALDEIHFREKQLERIDYLRHEMNSYKRT